MFPHLQHDLVKSNPGDYFEAGEPPTYHQIPLPPNVEILYVAQTIYDMAYTKNVCGYITDDAINYFIDERGNIEIDASKEFIFLAERGIKAFTHPTPLGIFSFLQEQCDKGLFISEGSAYYIEKTPATYQLCVELGDIWGENEFYESIEEIMKSNDTSELDSILSLLMKEYEKRKYGSASSVWDYINKNKDTILEEKLFLETEKFIVEEK